MMMDSNMISGGRLLKVDLSRCDYEFWLAAMSGLQSRYGDRVFVDDNPRQKDAMKRIADLLGEAASIYAALPPLPPK